MGHQPDASLRTSLQGGLDLCVCVCVCMRVHVCVGWGGGGGDSFSALINIQID